MIEPGYFLFVGCLLFLLIFATKQDKASLWIILTASIVGILMVVFITRQIRAPWKLVIPGTEETLTILALLGIGRNRTAYIQAVLLLIAWCAHLQCYLDLIWNTNVVYDHYEQIIASVAVLQLLGFHDTWFSIGRSVQKWCHIWAVGGDLISGSSGSSVVVRSADAPSQTKVT